MGLAAPVIANWQRLLASRTEPKCWQIAANPVGSGPGSRTVPLDGDWRFGSRLDPTATAPHLDDAAFARITLPHCVTRLSWQGWEPAAWQEVWLYRRHFVLPPECRGQRLFLRFDGVMAAAAPAINGHPLQPHLGGYLPFGYEITPWVKEDTENVLSVAVDSRPINAPPGSPDGKARIDYLQPGGIHRAVRLDAVPKVFISDIFAKPADVLEPHRRVEVLCSIDAAFDTAGPAPRSLELDVVLRRGERVVSRARQTVRVESAGPTSIVLTLPDLGNVALWDVDAPNLYELVGTLIGEGRPVHHHRIRIGLRDARFEREGFFLNGRRLQLFGLNRHELYPYVGAAMPARVMRRDAETLRHEFNCNIVRCSHYPQSDTFLDACDELGLMVWEEVPGWGYLGDAAWKDLLVQDARDMVIRDRNRPSVVIWGTRANESANDVELYRQTREVARSLDGSRPTSGSMTSGSRKGWESAWHEDVFAYDDYHADPDGSVGIDEPVPGVPYMLAEAVGQFNYERGRVFDAKYRRAGDTALQRQQALRHAQAHSRAASKPGICGVIAWCAFDYASWVNSYNGVKCPGVADVFRIPKLGASFYLAQADPNVRPVIAPDFFWDFGAQTPRGPGMHAAIFSNCDRLELFIDGHSHATLRPDSLNYPHLPHPPFFADLDLDGSGRPELRIDGHVNDKLVLSRSFSSDPTHDRFTLEADDATLIADGSDATRVVFKVVDKFGADRAFGGGQVAFTLEGPGVFVGDNPFSLDESGGVGAVWLRTRPDKAGRIVLTARHSTLGSRSVAIRVRGRKT